MTQRPAIGVVAWSVASGGAYAIAWLVETRRELNRLGARIPTPWLLLVPITALYWAWCWAEGVGHATGGRTSPHVAFALVCTGPIGMASVQARFNSLASTAAADSAAASARLRVTRRRRRRAACRAPATARAGTSR